MQKKVPDSLWSWTRKWDHAWCSPPYRLVYGQIKENIGKGTLPPRCDTSKICPLFFSCSKLKQYLRTWQKVIATRTLSDFNFNTSPYRRKRYLITAKSPSWHCHWPFLSHTAEYTGFYTIHDVICDLSGCLHINVEFFFFSLRRITFLIWNSLAATRFSRCVNGWILILLSCVHQRL